MSGEPIIRRVVPGDVPAAEIMGDAPAEHLYPAEIEHIARAVPKRRNEFTSVRYCARMALAELGLDRPALVPGKAGAPSWPAGVVGSMTHCAGYRAAVVGWHSLIASVGIDAEPDEPLPDGVLDSVSSATERIHLARVAARAPYLAWDRLLFSAKESVYKTWYPLMHRWLGFEDAELRFHPDGTFDADLLGNDLLVDGRPHGRLSGRWHAGRGLLLSAIVLRR